MFFGVVGPLVQHACASHNTTAPVHHCAEMSGAHADHAGLSDTKPMSDCAESGMDCCTVESHAADRVRVDLRSPERVAPAVVAFAVLTGIPFADDTAYGPPLLASDHLPDRPVRLHLWTATFLN